VTMEEAMRRVTGVILHPVFEKARPDIVVAPGPNRTVSVNGPRDHLDGISRALTRTGLEIVRPAPATLVVVF
jgi:hypothetical protein